MTKAFLETTDEKEVSSGVHPGVTAGFNQTNQKKDAVQD